MELPELWPGCQNPRLQETFRIWLCQYRETPYAYVVSVIRKTDSRILNGGRRSVGASDKIVLTEFCPRRTLFAGMNTIRTVAMAGIEPTTRGFSVSIHISGHLNRGNVLHNRGNMPLRYPYSW